MRAKVISIATMGAEVTAPPVRGRVVRSHRLRNLLTFLMAEALSGATNLLTVP